MAQGAIRQLADGLHQAQVAAGDARLPHRQLAAGDVQRKIPLPGEVVAAHELWGFALGAEAQVL